MLRRDGMQARRQKHHLLRKNRQLTIRPVLGVTATREPDNTHDITSPQLLMLGLERDIPRGKLSLTHDLHLHALSADIVENQLGSGRTLGVDTTRDADGDIGLLSAFLQTLVVLQILAQIIGDLELMRVGIRLLGLS